MKIFQCVGLTYSQLYMFSTQHVCNLPQPSLENFVEAMRGADVWLKRLIETLRRAKARQPRTKCIVGRRSPPLLINFSAVDSASPW